MHSYIPMIPQPRWQDVLDILIVALVIYRIAMLIRGTRTMQMVLGLVIVGGAFVAVHKDPALGWHPTVMTAPAAAYQCQCSLRKSPPSFAQSMT